MSVIRFGCVVEGHSEVTSLPILLQRLVRAANPEMVVVVPEPVRVHRDKFIAQTDEMFKKVSLAAGKAGPGHPLLILLDSEGDCPATLGPRIIEQAREICPGRPTGCVIAHQEFESWFLASPYCIREHFRLSAAPEPPDDPESKRGAKEWIKQQLPRGRTYSETIDQPGLTRLFNLQKARSIPSFDKMYREVARLVAEFEGV